jgi:hypothetical protein
MPAQHVINTPWGTHDDVNTVAEFGNIITDLLFYKVGLNKIYGKRKEGCRKETGGGWLTLVPPMQAWHLAFK